MEFHEKLQELRKRAGFTQEELANRLYVSRTAISKWESGRGYPNIDSLKEIAKFFSVTLDELLSSDEVLALAKEDQKQTRQQFCNTIFGLLDCSAAMLLFLPFFAERSEDVVKSVALLNLITGQASLKAVYIAAVLLMTVFGIVTLALQVCQADVWIKSKTKISLALSALTVLLFMLGLHPYAAVFTFVLLAIKVFLLIKRQ